MSSSWKFKLLNIHPIPICHPTAGLCGPRRASSCHPDPCLNGAPWLAEWATNICERHLRYPRLRPRVRLPVKKPSCFLSHSHHRCLSAGHGLSVPASRTCGCERSVNFVCTSAPRIKSFENEPGQPDWRIPPRPSWTYPSTELVNGSRDLSQEPCHVLSTAASNIHPPR